MHTIVFGDACLFILYECVCGGNTVGTSNSCCCYISFVAKIEQILGCSKLASSVLGRLASALGYEGVPKVGLSFRASMQVGNTTSVFTDGLSYLNGKLNEVGVRQRDIDGIESNVNKVDNAENKVLEETRLVDEVVDVTLSSGSDQVRRVAVPGAFGSTSRVESRGVNYERNCVNRDKRKTRKLKRQAMQGKSWRDKNVQSVAVPVPALDGGGSSPAKDCGANGFWNSCSDDMRRQLIESKARMHVASNNKKAEEDERRVKQLQSPEQILRDAMRLVNFANDQAKAKNDSKVSGWAKTVAESYAETIAKSAPTSVESFESFVQSNSSITSVSIEAFNEIVKIKDEQLKVLDTQSKTLDTQSRTLDELNKRIAELEVIAKSRGNITVKCGVLGKCGEKKSIGNAVTGASNAKIVQRNTQVNGTTVASNCSTGRVVSETAKPERIMSQEHFLKFGKQPGVFFDGKDVFC